jgi:hypothetical protein
MDRNKAKNWTARMAMTALVVSAVSGCAATSKATAWLKGERTADAQNPVILGAPAADTYLKELSDLAAGDPATQAEIYADASAAAQLIPGPNTELRLALDPSSAPDTSGIITRHNPPEQCGTPDRRQQRGTPPP